MDVTGTIAAPRAQPPLVADKEGNYPQFHLPNAPRTRMRTCGLKWQDMKLAGNAGDDTWRDFAKHCLSASDEAPEVTGSRKVP